jgi:hypothetical protein
LAFQNPHFGVSKNSRSTLQPEHPEFSPSEDCTPRRLFGPPRKGASKAKAQTASKRSPSPASDDDAEDDDAFGAPPRATLAQEFKRIGKTEGKMRLSPVKERKESADVAAVCKEGTKVTTSSSKGDETLT